MEAAHEMSEGDETAVAVIRELIAVDQVEAARLLEDLDDMNIRGKQLAYAFQWFARNDLATLALGIRQHSRRLVQTVNKMRDAGYQAVVTGGSPRQGRTVA